MSKLEQLSRIGQSIWLDYIRRAFLASGELEALIKKGLRGVTSNPSIFEKAIAGSADYDDQLKSVLEEGRDVTAIYEALVLEDIAVAADQLRSVYGATDGRDGFVSLEVRPVLADDAEGTIAEARRLFQHLGRPNVMIKVPATRAGLVAIRQLIADGVNVNVTLIFSLENYQEVAAAYLEGIHRLAEQGPQVEGGLPVQRVASVASVFISRVDTAVDRALAEVGERRLQGKMALANARFIYQAFREIFSGADWEALQADGARLQRLLWASTGVKNPLSPDTLYVDQLIGPNTVNTLPPATLTAFWDHGTVKQTLPGDVEEAWSLLKQLSALGIDLSAITNRLQQEGVAAFAQSFQKLLDSIAGKLESLRQEKTYFAVDLGKYQPVVEQARRRLRKKDVIGRLWKHDYTIWKDDPHEITDRLGWLHSPETMGEAVPDIQAFVESVRGDGLEHVLLLGMGGSSLAPEVLARIFGAQPGYLALGVLDTTDPDAVAEALRQFPPKNTLYLVSTKSGTTVETLSLFKFFYNQTLQAMGKEQVGSHFAAITDPGSALETLAEQLNFRKVFLNDATIGGRYSTLSYFGLVPAGLVGVDLSLLLDRAGTMACNCEGCNCPMYGNNTGAHLGAILGALALQGRDKLTLVSSKAIAPFGSWLEQLVAESTGKEGRGILPVDGEALLEPAHYRNDRLFVYLKLEAEPAAELEETLETLKRNGQPVVTITLRDRYDLGGEFFRWEVAIAVAGYFLAINPFDQPNVESAKILARDMVVAYQKAGHLPEPPPDFRDERVALWGEAPGESAAAIVTAFLDKAIDALQGAYPLPYVALQAYLKPDPATWRLLHLLRTAIQKRYRVATTVGYGPRFLHSTGQLHKGDAGHGVFLQLTTTPQMELSIPEAPGSERSQIGFGMLKLAQALGDWQALQKNGRKILRLHAFSEVHHVLENLIRNLV